MVTALEAAYAALFLGFALPRAWFARLQRRAPPAREVAWRREPVRFPAMMALGALGLAGTAAFLLARDATRALDLALPEAARWAGLPLGAAGVALFAWSHQALGLAWSVRIRVREDAGLVTSGPYARVRHPMYTAILLWAAGLLLTSANLAAAGPWLALTALAASRVADEEAALAEAFGDAYRAYARRTGRFLPRLGPPAPQG